MNRLARNSAILLTGAALIPAGVGLGYEAGYDPTGEDATAVADYQQCARELGATAARQPLPNDCQELIVYREPSRHHNQTYPSSDSVVAGEVKLDRQGYEVAKSQVEHDWKITAEACVIGFTALWAMGVGGELLMGVEKSESKT